jgi:transketolase
MRRKIADLVYSQMEKDKNVWVIVADLGYKMWDQCFLDFPDRCINVGASEQSMIGIAVGLSLSGKMVFCYSISTFLLYRPFEWIRNYLSWGQVPVKLLGGGSYAQFCGCKAISSPRCRTILA